MGGRGASSGMSKEGNPYGSQYHTIIEVDNIKFVAKNNRESETLMETMTSGRVYVETGGNDILRIIHHDESNKRNKVLELDKRTGEWHAHHGYFHTEYSNKEHDELTKEDKKEIERIKRIWNNRTRA